jgi:hypothetical protein
VIIHANKSSPLFLSEAYHKLKPIHRTHTLKTAGMLKDPLGEETV